MYWIAIGSPDNWKTTIEGKRIWGLAPRYKSNWSKVSAGDMLLFYATRPVQGLVGFGEVRSKKLDKTPLWPEEETAKAAVWPLRLLLDIQCYLKPQQWTTQKVPLPEGVFLPRGFQTVKDGPAKKAIAALQARS